MRRFFPFAIAAILIAGFVLAGCKKDEDIKFTISQNSDLVLGAEEQTAAVSVFAPGSWTVSSDADWLSFTTSQTSFSLKAADNSVAAQRTASVTVLCGEEVHIFKVIQSGAEEVFVVREYDGEKSGEIVKDGKTYSTGGAASSLGFIIESNLPDSSPMWKIETEEDWISAEGGVDIFNVALAVNHSAADRTGSFAIVSASGKTRVTVNVAQTALVIDEIAFVAPDVITYKVYGEPGVEYFTGLFDSKEFKRHARNSFQDLNEAFYEATPVSGIPAKGPVYTVSSPDDLVTYTGSTAIFFYNMLGGQPIQAGGQYLICVCKKEDARKGDLDGVFYSVEFTVPAQEGEPITALPPVFEEE